MGSMPYLRPYPGWVVGIVPAMYAGNPMGMAGQESTQAASALTLTHWCPVCTLVGAGAGAQTRVDYIASFKVAVPVINFTTLWKPGGEGGDGGEAGAVDLFCVQTTAVQQYSLNPELCRPGGCLWRGDGVRFACCEADFGVARASRRYSWFSRQVCDSGLVLLTILQARGRWHRRRSGSSLWGPRRPACRRYAHLGQDLPCLSLGFLAGMPPSLAAADCILAKS